MRPVRFFHSPKNAAEHFGLVEPWDLAPNRDIRPTTPIPVVVPDHQGRRAARLFRWGLVPSWAKPDFKTLLINARAETLHYKPSFRDALAKRRCLVAADVFYEWSGPKGHRQAHAFTLAQGGPMALAGLWESWAPPQGGEPLLSCAIVTTRANSLVAGVHDRMPVILAPDAYQDWLDIKSPAQAVIALLEPFPAQAMAVAQATL